jgi:hypothetical protein
VKARHRFDALVQTAARVEVQEVVALGEDEVEREQDVRSGEAQLRRSAAP